MLEKKNKKSLKLNVNILEESNPNKELLLKRIKKKLQELSHEKILKADEEVRENQRKMREKNISRILKNLTSSILIQIAEGVFQSIISFGACITYVINTYYEDRSIFKRENLFFKIIKNVEKTYLKY